MADKNAMIPFERALRIVMDAARPVGTERVPLHDSLGRILAEDVLADMDIPPFNKSAMDGYACRRADLGNTLDVIENVPAGSVPRKTIGPNQCARIMTGAMVPEGADCVIMLEYTQNPTENTVRFVGKSTSDNICAKGEDLRRGDVVLQKGTPISPAHIAVMAAVGCCRPLVSQRVKLGIITTGNEIVEPEVKPSPSQIRNSNASQLLAQAQRMGLSARYSGIVGDTEDSLASTIREAASSSDVILLSGGVSMGDFDLVPGVLQQTGFNLLFEQVATKPGKPTVFGLSGKTFVFGLPGNPVSTFVIFETIVKPFLFKMMGHVFQPPNITARLDKSISRKKTERLSWLPVALTEAGGALPVEYHGSAHVHALCFADGLIAMPVGVAELPEGTTVHVRQI